MIDKNIKNLPLHKLLITKLKALYDIECEITKALPKLAKAATNKKLKLGFQGHLAETRRHVARLKQAFRLLGEKVQKTKVEAIRGLAKDADWVIKNVPKGPALDSNLIAAASYVEHYEMAGYMAAESWAKQMRHTKVAKLLNETLKEEKGADTKMFALSKEINRSAL
ncbi:MAG TPA: DUF892 family protein [Candidatus Paceibacterota bacterium]|nr:DUF892 family protein [Candidatus Paceibacterota bacterium]